MSFPRAKIQRFNDVTSCTPSPADYNVNALNRTGGAVIPQSERFAVPQSPALSETSSFVSQGSTGTPSSKIAGTAKKTKPHTFQKPKPKDLFANNDHVEALKEKIVELNNKDLFIKDLVEQLDELKQKVCDLQSNLMSKEQDYQNNVTDIKSKHDNLIKNLKEEHKVELEQFINKIKEIEIEVSNIRKEYEELKVKTKADLIQLTNDMQDQIQNGQQLFSDKIQHILEEKAIEIQTLQEQFQKEHDKLQNESEAKVKQLQEDFREANILADMQMQEKLQDLEINWKAKLEKQEKDAEQILKECQAISEYNIIQGEIEKNQIKTELKQKINQYDEVTQQKCVAVSKCRELETTVDKLHKKISELAEELDQTRLTLEKEIEDSKIKIEKLDTKKRVYEVTISKLHETIEALKKRLINSDRDVEQLKAELESCEQSKLEYETKCNHLNEELKLVQTLNEELEIKNETTLKVTEEKIQKLEKSLLEKVENYNTVAQECRKELEEKLHITETNLKDAMEQLHQQKKLTDESEKLIGTANLELNRLETLVIDYEFKNNRLQVVLKTLQKECDTLRNTEQEIKAKQIATVAELTEKVAENEQLKSKLNKLLISNEEVENFMKQIAQLQEKSDSYYKYCEHYKAVANEYQREIEELGDIRKKYIEQSSKYEDIALKYEQLENTNAALNKKIAEQESLIGPFREQLEAYEMEHRALLNEKQDAVNEAKEMSLKYASALGHQNKKQKIKFLVDLQAKKFELVQNKKELEAKVRSQSRTIEKLKKELLTLTKNNTKPKSQAEDKENWNSPHRLMNTSDNESPTTPLKERN